MNIVNSSLASFIDFRTISIFHEKQIQSLISRINVYPTYGTFAYCVFALVNA